MPLINFAHKKEEAPADAVWSAHHQVWTWKEEVGLCLCEREANYYNDSDFYMTIWDEATDQPKEVMFATTRGWSYPALGSSVDARPDIRAKYDAWLKARDEAKRAESRRSQARVKRANKALMSLAGQRHGIPYARMIRLRALPECDALVALFGARIRSPFKKSLREQVIAWLNDDAPKYDHPLSKKQRSWLKA